MRIHAAALAVLLSGLGLWAIGGSAAGASPCHGCRASVSPRIAAAEAVARREAKLHGDAHAVITRIETVRIPGYPGRRDRWIMIQLRSRHAFDVACPSSRPGPPGPCGAHYLEIGVHREKFGLIWGLTASQVSAVARVRHAYRWLRFFPDTPALHVRCAIGRGGPKLSTTKPLAGICTTIVEPSNHVRRVVFQEDYRLSPYGKLRTARWIVTVSRSGRVRLVRVTGQPPQLWR